MPKPTILYSAGTYGALLLRILNNANPTVSESYHLHSDYFECKYTMPNREDHHLISEHAIEGDVVKITFTEDDVDLINRNKWTKVVEHLKTQAEKTFPNNPNRNLYTMAIHVCNLLADKQFKQAEKDDTQIFKFEHFLGCIGTWKNKFNHLFEHYQIPFDVSLIEKHYDCFQKGQENILEKNKKQNDDIHQSYILGKEYFKLYQNNFDYSESRFEKLRRAYVH
tara:strand:- start:27 stop:695 length:669 start_codon:yes stop_codon:yes gene_type:complete